MASSDRIPVEMAGLPVFDRDRQFSGYRGFGICRNLERLAAHTARPVAEAISAQISNANVLPFPAPKPAEPTLSPIEQATFQELGRNLSDRLKKTAGRDVPAQMDDDFGPELVAPVPPVPAPAPPRQTRNGEAARDTQEARPILDRLPIGVLVYRLNNLVYANRAFLDWTGFASLDALADAGGLDSLFIESKVTPAAKGGNGGKTLTISTPQRQADAGRRPPVQHHLERRQRAGADAQHRAGDCRGRQQGNGSGAAPRRG